MAEVAKIKNRQPRADRGPEDDNAVEAIAARIMRGIRKGRYVPGQRLIEADLVEEFGASRGPVREALRILAGDGIVELVPRKGARVRKLSAADIADLFAVLSGLLQVTVRLAIDKVGHSPWRERLDVAMARMRQARALEDFPQFQLAGIRYADLLMEAASNRYLEYLNAKLHPELFYRQVSGVVQIEDWNAYLAHFESIHAALQAGNLERVQRLLQEHEATMAEMFRATDEEVI